MKLVEKLKESKEKQRKKNIEQCKQHPTKWKVTSWLFAIGFLLMAAFDVAVGAYPLAIIAIVFGILLGRDYFKIYKAAFPKIDQAVEGLA